MARAYWASPGHKPQTDLAMKGAVRRLKQCPSQCRLVGGVELAVNCRSCPKSYEGLFGPMSGKSRDSGRRQRPLAALPTASIVQCCTCNAPLDRNPCGHHHGSGDQGVMKECPEWMMRFLPQAIRNPNDRLS